MSVIDSPIIQFKGVSKKYKDLLALDDVSFDIKQGEIFGYIGPNGAGKTTSIKILVGLLRNYEGAVFIKNIPINESKENIHKFIGYLPQDAAFQEWRTVDHALKTFGKLSGLKGIQLEKRIIEVLTTVNLLNFRNKKIAQLSGGMQQKLLFAQAILNKPEILILDEPLSGLDPTSRYQIKNMIKKFAQKDVTILFSSHILSDVQDFADKIGILNHGKLLKVGSPEELQQKLDISHVIEIEYKEKSPFLSDLDKYPFIISINNTQKKNIQQIQLDVNRDIESSINTLLKEIINQKVYVRGFNLLKPNLEDVYLKYIKDDDK
jgi:ABC-2 type transport system ATP-binding protein